MSLPATFVRISHGCHERAEREAVMLETRVYIAQSVDHRQYDRAVHFQYPYLDLYRGYTHSTNLTDIIYHYYGLYFHEHSHLPCIQNMIQCLEESDHDIWKGVKVMVRYCKQAHVLIILGGKLIHAFIIEDVY